MNYYTQFSLCSGQDFGKDDSVVSTKRWPRFRAKTSSGIHSQASRVRVPSSCHFMWTARTSHRLEPAISVRLSLSARERPPRGSKQERREIDPKANPGRSMMMLPRAAMPRLATCFDSSAGAHRRPRRSSSRESALQPLEASGAMVLGRKSTQACYLEALISVVERLLPRNRNGAPVRCSTSFGA
jgi:hypothetical protein